MIWARRILALLTLGPILFWLACIGIVLVLGGPGGCRIDEGSAHPCILLGADFGEIVHGIGIFAAWGPLIFAPLVVGSGLLWAIVAVIARIRRKT